MSDSIIQRLEKLVTTGAQLIPQGGFDFSGYNARLQNKYLEWRKACLEALEESGPIGFPYKNKILGDQNGGYFFQSSAQLIHGAIKELFDKLKSSPDLATAASAKEQATAAPVTQSTTPGGARVLRPPPKPASATAAVAPPSASPSPTNGGVGKKVYVIGEENDPLIVQLSQFLAEIGLEEVLVKRVHGQMLELDSFRHDADVRYAFFVFNSEDLAYAMFELGHFVGSLGKGMVSVLHMSDVNFPRNVPGVSVKTVVLKLEESSLAIMRELKGAGYKISL